MDNISQAQEKFSLLDHVPLGVCVLHPDGTVLFWNSCLEEWTNIPRSKILGSDISEHFPHFNQPKYANRLEQIFQGGPPTIFSSQLHKYIIPSPLPQGRYRVQHTTVTAVPALDGLGFYALLSIQDVTDLTFRVQEYRTMRDRALAEAMERQRAQETAEAANRVKDQFLAILSHELRTPLNPILGWSKLLKKGNLDAAATGRALDAIERNAKLQVQLIDDLLDISRIIRGKFNLNWGKVDLAFAINSALETVLLAAEAKSIQIKLTIDKNVGQVLGDINRLQQVIWNLLSNAVKFTPNGGMVEVRLVATPNLAPTEIVHGKQSNPLAISHSAEITISDTGKGISPDFLPYMFEYFRQADSSTTRKFGGLGLGLAIVRHIVELHGGTIRAESPGEGEGSTFTVRLPLINSPTIMSDENSEQSQTCVNIEGVKILIVDDDVDTQDFLSFLLQEYGAIATVAGSAKEAIDQLAQSLPDLLLSDLGMPEVDGLTLIRQIRAMPPEQGGHIPAIALTAYAAQTTQQQVLAAGFQQHIAKPVEPNHLVSAIAHLVKNSQSKIIL